MRTKTIDLVKEFRLPNPTTPEDLEMRFRGMDGTVLTYGDKIILAGYYWNGPGEPCYFAAAYENLDEGELDGESTIGLLGATPANHKDDGHAIAWAISYWG